MVNKADYIAWLQRQFNNCTDERQFSASACQCMILARETAGDFNPRNDTHEAFRGKSVWKGDLEVFDLTGPPKANRCYAWSRGDPDEFITILGSMPVRTARGTEKVSVAHQIKRERK